MNASGSWRDLYFTFVEEVFESKQAIFVWNDCRQGFLVPFNGWLLAGLGPVGLSGFCGAFVSGFPRVGGLHVAADGCFGGIGAGSLRSVGWGAE